MGSSPSKRRPQSHSYTETSDTAVSVVDISDDELDDVKAIQLQEQWYDDDYQGYEDGNYGNEIEINDETKGEGYNNKDGSGYYSDPNYDEHAQTHAQYDNTANGSADEYYSYDVADDADEYNKNDFAYDGLENEADVDVEFLGKDLGNTTLRSASDVTVTESIPGQID